MIVCPNCNHQNPEGSTQCENCYTPLPQTTSCPNCGASVQTDATFCGQCGFNLQAEMIEPVMDLSASSEAYPELTFTANTESTESIPTPAMSSSLQSPWDEEERPTVTPEEMNSWQNRETEVMSSQQSPSSSQFAMDNSWANEELVEELPNLDESEALPDLAQSQELYDLANSLENTTTSDSISSDLEAELFSPTSPPLEESIDSFHATEESSFSVSPSESQESVSEVQSSFSVPPSESEEITSEADLPFSPVPEPEQASTEPERSAPAASFGSATQLQIQTAKLLHVQTNTDFEIPPNLAVVHIGKPNSQIPPDIDVSELANSDVVSRIHADIRVEGDAYFIEDVGSSNGTYINHSPLLVGNRHRLRSGDRIALGKGDLVTFIFQIY